jgi:XTP/dITP diphosphohydrolase
MRLLVATTNPGKLREIRSLMAGVPLELLSLADVAPIAEPEETGTTFEENARLKARYYATHSGMLTVTEDSGIVIDALGGDPGVRSARFLAPDASYPERFAEILRRIDAHRGNLRTARFVAAVACAEGPRIVYETTGVVEGEIADAPRGMNGFGYDPIFYYPPYGKTLGEVSEAEKVRIAHRGIAFRAFARWISSEHGLGGQPLSR